MTWYYGSVFSSYWLKDVDKVQRAAGDTFTPMEAGVVALMTTVSLRQIHSQPFGLNHYQGYKHYMSGAVVLKVQTKNAQNTFSINLWSTTIKCLYRGGTQPIHNPYL